MTVETARQVILSMDQEKQRKDEKSNILKERLSSLKIIIRKLVSEKQDLFDEKESLTSDKDQLTDKLYRVLEFTKEQIESKDQSIEELILV